MNDAAPPPPDNPGSAPAVRDFDVTAAGHRLRARTIGAAAAADQPTLVFLHEGLGSIGQWRDVPETLVGMTGLPALVYERWGFGQSEPLVLPRPTSYLEEEAERALPDVLAACGIKRPLLIGHSDGGTIALLYAAAFPERPAACITEAAHVFVEEISLNGIHDAIAAYAATDLRQRLARYHGDQTETVFRGWAETWTRPDFRDWQMTDRLPSITCPVLAIQGEDDHYGSPDQVAAIVERVSGPAQPLMVPDCGHTPHHEQQESALAAMAGFVGRVAGRNTGF